MEYRVVSVFTQVFSKPENNRIGFVSPGMFSLNGTVLAVHLCYLTGAQLIELLSSLQSGGLSLRVIWGLWISLSALKTTYKSFKTQEKIVQKMGLKNTTPAECPAPVQKA
ncbi:MAG: hypothetical protein ACR65R_07370 [Methylomicrobium sp.]